MEKFVVKTTKKYKLQIIISEGDKELMKEKLDGYIHYPSYVIDNFIDNILKMGEYIREFEEQKIGDYYLTLPMEGHWKEITEFLDYCKVEYKVHTIYSYNEAVFNFDTSSLPNETK